MKKLLILDSNSIINRAFYGIRMLTTREGLSTNAVYGFMNILLKLISELEPDYICAAFDVKHPTFRHEMYADYKAQRKPAPKELIEQFEPAKEILRGMNIKILEKPGFEADDIIGTVSRICNENDVECFIATGDKDDLQLAGGGTKIILTVTKSGNNETVIYDDEGVKERYGVTPTEFIDVKALMGDQSDNIPGVAGIGEKTAVSLISKYGSIEYIYDNIDSLDIKGAVLRKLTEGRESAFLSKKLSIIDRRVPIEFAVTECEYTSEYKPELYETLERLELKSIIKRLGIVPGEAEEKKDIFEGFVFREITSVGELERLAETIGAEGCISADIEFSGSKLTAAGISFGKNSYYISNINEDDMLRILLPVLENGNIKKTVCDIKSALVNLDGKACINGIDYDIAVASYLIDPSVSEYSFDYMSQKYLGISVTDESGTGQMSFFEESSDYTQKCRKVAAYAMIREKTAEILKKNNQTKLFEDIEMPLIKVLADMQIAGMYIDRGALGEFAQKLSEGIKACEDRIYDMAGEEFNINSPQQLGTVLFDKMGLPPSKKSKRGYSTNAEVLEKLKPKHEIISHILEYRHLAKLKSTYCDSILSLINTKTGRIHSVFNQMVTVTGRISSTEPNMQNIPVRTELGREIRKMFIAERDDFILVDADYSQIELRILAHMSGDRNMIDAFNSGEDIHTVTASQVFGVPVSEVTKAQRSNAKAVNFGIVYGIGEYSLAGDLNISVAEAKRYINQYLEKYSGVRDYMSGIKERAKADGYVKTMMNRIRYIPELKSSNYNVRSFGERAAMNMPIQGTAADIIKLAMIRVHKRLAEGKFRSKLIIQVHDELLIETCVSEKEEVKAILREEMENAAELSVPLVVDMSEGRSWYDAK
ncbi:MAG: DNA polymerase I [Oscillospiraceae bacterium]|nr:DNA polymerase I [Oscillospiraceae bacterium]